MADRRLNRRIVLLCVLNIFCSKLSPVSRNIDSKRFGREEEEFQSDLIGWLVRKKRTQIETQKRKL